MIEMPPLQFAETNGIRMGFYEAGPQHRRAAGRALPRLAGDGVFLASPDQGAERGRHPRDCAGSARLWRDRPARARRSLRYRAPDRRSRRPARPSRRSTRRFSSATTGAALSSGRCRFGIVDRVAGVVGVNTPHTAATAGRSDRTAAQAVRRQHVYRAVSGSRARARQDIQQPGRADFRCLHAQAAATQATTRRRRRRLPVSARRRRPIWRFRR